MTRLLTVLPCSYQQHACSQWCSDWAPHDVQAASPTSGGLPPFPKAGSWAHVAEFWRKKVLDMASHFSPGVLGLPALNINWYLVLLKLSLFWADSTEVRCLPWKWPNPVWSPAPHIVPEHHQWSFPEHSWVWPWTKNPKSLTFGPWYQNILQNYKEIIEMFIS